MKWLLVATTVITIISTGCATVISGSTKTVQIKAQEGAKISVVNSDGYQAASGTTELTADLPRGLGYWRPAGYQVNVSKPGYKSKSVDILPAFNGWYLVNLTPFVGIIGGLFVDPISGAFYTFDNDQFEITLEPTGQNIGLTNRITEAEVQARNYPVSRHDYIASQKAKSEGCTPLASPKVENYGTHLETLTFQCLKGNSVSLLCSSYDGCVVANN